MSKKKRFGISEALTRGLSETIHVVENNSGTFRHIVLPLSRIELDPDNPRKLALRLEDVRHGIPPNDPAFERKQNEFERLKELAHTIQTSGVINPVVVYKRGEVYRIVAGERRCLASIIAGKQEIEARVFNDKPKGFELKLIQWIENTAREDLSLDERLGNVREIIREYQAEAGDQEVSATILKNITGLSLSQSTYYLSAINAPQDVQLAIQSGNIRNLDKAALIANISSQDLRREAIAACEHGVSLKELRQLISQHKRIKKDRLLLATPHRGRVSARINMGTTNLPQVVQCIVNSVLSSPTYQAYRGSFAEINWLDFRQSTKAFRRLIEIMETEMVN